VSANSTFVLSQKLMPSVRQVTDTVAKLNNHVPIWLLAALVFAALWLHTFRLINDDHASALAVAEEDVVNLARVSQEHAERIFYSADHILRMVRSEYKEKAHGGPIELQEMRAQGVFDEKTILQVSVADAHGIIQISSLPLSDRLDVSDREYFKTHVTAVNENLFISSPEFDLAYGKWSIRISRGIIDDFGEFGGVVVVQVDPTYFTRFYGDLQLGHQGVAALYGLTGSLLARKTPGTETFSGNEASSPIFARVAQGADAGTLTYRSVADGVERIYHFKKLPSYPLLVVIGEASSDVFARQEKTRVQRLWEAAVLSVLLLVVSSLFSWYVVFRRRQSRKQRKLLAQLKSLSDHVPGMAYQYLRRTDGSSCFLFVSEGAREIYRLSPEEIMQNASRECALIHPDDAARVAASIEQSVKTLVPWSHEYRVKFADGTVRWLLGKAAPQRQADGSVLCSGFVSDVTVQKVSEEQLRIAATAFELEDGMFITDAAGTILRVNQSFCRVSGYPAQEAVGQTPRLLNSGHHDAVFYAAMHASLKQTGAWQGEIWNRRKNGEIIPEWLNIAAVRDRTGAVTHYVSTLSDISKRKAAEAEIQQLAFYDSLTGLPNRRLLVERLTQALAARVRSDHKGNGALLFIDVDNFKNLNDTQGHEQGDLMLEQVATRLNYCVREGDMVARLGGDDFVVMLLDLSDNTTEAASQAETVGQKVLDTLRQTYQFGGETYHGSVSVGVTLFQASHDSVEELFKRADLALYQAKDAGRDTLRFFDPQMQASMSARAELEADLREGILNDQFLLYYQPQVDQQGRLLGVEALVRWRHPRRGMVSPASFIPLAEETGLILPLGQWVLETACLQLHEWAAQPERAYLTISVNVSVVQFQRESFVAHVLATLERNGAPPNRLKLELTESLLVRDIEDIIVKMVALKSHGVGFSLDDFGTGFSSLSYLKRLPLDQIKIDQSFVSDAATNAKDAALVRATVAMGHGLGMSVIAEGVETQVQRDFLEHEGCHNYQGYFFGRPVPVQELERLFPA
jgi:diguanylate cyclase (GGDEF)-like protein/PAS domain S-box-containing protein